jgi:hypothetical protein
VRLKANVRRYTGKTRHLVHGRESEEIASTIQRVEIQPDDEAFLLLYFNASEDCVADTWHQTLDQAKEQANFEFEIEEADWSALT